MFKVEQKNAINVLADFPEVGYDIREWYDKMKILVPVIFFLLLLGIFSVIRLGKYLDEESKKQI